MRVLFIVPNLSGDFYKANYPHIGVGYLISALNCNNHISDVIDMRIHSKLKHLDKKVKSFKPDMIGVSFMSRSYKESYKFINMLKRRYGGPIVIGGPHISLFKEKVLESCDADYAVYGEGELAIVALADGKKLKDVPNLIWRDEDKIKKNKLEFVQNLDSLPFPDYTNFPLKSYIDKKMPIVTSRGCPYNCVYCSIKTVMGKAWRPRSANHVIKEIELWKKRGYNYFLIPDDNFSLDKKRVEEFCNLIIEKNLNIKWELRNGIRSDTVDEDLLRLMKKAGCYFIAYGVESLDEEVLKESKKNLNPASSENAVALTKKVGIKTGAFFILGLPKDTLKKFYKTIQFVKKHKLDEFEINNCVPYPNTEMADWVNKNGKFFKTPEDYLSYASYWKEDLTFDTPEFTAEERSRAYKYAERLMWKKLLKNEYGFLSVIAYPAYINRTLRKIFTKPGFFLWYYIRKIKWALFGRP